jgi:pimeloyl-ACP methyl ester carboxylesterase
MSMRSGRVLRARPSAAIPCRSCSTASFLCAVTESVRDEADLATAHPDAHVCLLDVLGIGRAAVMGGSAGAPSALQIPTLIVSAHDDRCGNFASAAYTASRITGAKFIGFDHGGHTWVGHDDGLMSESRNPFAHHQRADEGRLPMDSRQ